MVEKKKTQSIKVKFNGTRSTGELRSMLNEAVDQLEAKGVKQVFNCNLYVTPVTEFRSKAFDHITIDTPYKCAADEIDP